FALNWLVNDDWKIQASAVTHRIDADGNNLVDVDAHTLKPLYGEYVQNARVDQPSETELDLYNLTAKGRLGIFDVVSSTTYQTFDSSSTSDATDLYGVLLGAIFHLPTLGTFLTQETSTERWSQELRFDASALDGRLTYQFG